MANLGPTFYGSDPGGGGPGSGFTTDGVLYAASASTAASTAAGTAGQIVTSNGAGNAPTYQNAPGAAFYTGYMPFNTNWTTTSATLVDPTPGGTGGTNTLVQRGGSGVSVSAAASNLPGIILTPSSTTAVYRVTAKFISGNDSGACANLYTLTDGTNIYDTSGYQSPDIAGAAGSYDYDECFLEGYIATGSTSAITLKIQMATNSSTAYIRNDNSGLASGRPSIEWKVFKLAN